MKTVSLARRSARIIAGATAGLALAIAVPLAASAHVHVTPEDASAGATTRLAFSFSHGCEDSPTTAIVIDVPEGIGNTTPVLDGAWSIERTLGDDGTPTQVRFIAVEPIEGGVAASVSLDVLIDSSSANTDIAFPVTQECVDGSTAWVEVADEGEDAEQLEAPAPVLAVGAAVEDGDGHGHSDAESSEHADADSATDAAASADPIARWLAGGALVAGIAALVVALLRKRRA